MIALLATLLAVLNSAYAPASYACDGSTVAYSVSFPYQSYTDLVATSTTAGGVVTTLVYTTDFTVNFTSTQSVATLTLTAGSKCPNLSTLKIARNTQRTQPSSFKAQTNYSQALHELAYDRVTMLVQELAGNPGGLPVLVTAPITGFGTVASPLGCAVAGSATGCIDLGAHTWTGTQTIASTSGDGISSTGNGAGYGVRATAGATAGTPGLWGGGGASGGYGVVGVGTGIYQGGYFTGGGTSGSGIIGNGGTPNGYGINGQGAGTGVGVSGIGGVTNGIGITGQGVGAGIGGNFAGGATGDGIIATGGATSGRGGQFIATGANDGAFGTGSGGGAGVRGQGQGAGAGLIGTGGATSGIGGSFTGGTPNGAGVTGNGIGTGAGGNFAGGATAGATGLNATGASGGGNGAQGFGVLTGTGVVGTGGATGPGVTGTGGATSGTGVIGQGGATSSTGVSGIGGSTNGFGVVGTGAGAGGGGSFTGGATGPGTVTVGNATAEPLRLTALSAAPSTPVDGGIYYDSTVKAFQGRANGAWVAMSATFQESKSSSSSACSTSGVSVSSITVSVAGTYRVTFTSGMTLSASDTSITITLQKNSSGTSPVVQVTGSGITENKGVAVAGNFTFAASDTIRAFCVNLNNSATADDRSLFIQRLGP